MLQDRTGGVLAIWGRGEAYQLTLHGTYALSTPKQFRFIPTLRLTRLSLAHAAPTGQGPPLHIQRGTWGVPPPSSVVRIPRRIHRVQGVQCVLPLPLPLQAAEHVKLRLGG